MKKISGIVCLLILFVFATAVLAEQIVRIAPLTYSVLSTNTTVNATATALPTTALVGRESIVIRNNEASTKTLYIGGSSVTTANGFPLDATTPSISLDADSSITVYGIATSGTIDVRIIEAK